MKKFLLIILIFFCWSNVYASERSFRGSEYLDNIYYMKDNGVITQYKRGQVIRDTVTGEIAYCIEPFGVIKEGSNYSETELYDKRFEINEEVWEKLKLYAYYGYGYKDHLDKDWISITQVAIWRALYPNSLFYYIDNTTTGNVIPKYNNELDEINNTVNNYLTLPSFEKEYVYSVDEDVILSDLNDVLKFYTIVYSDFESSIINNQLKIKTGNDVKEGKIVIKRGEDLFPNSVKYFYSESSQNVMERGNINPISMELKISVKTGKIIVNKEDSETHEKAQGEAELNGAVFELLNEKEEVIKELTINNNTLEFDFLPFGKYYIREKKPGIGYYLNKEKYEVLINENNLEQKITVNNDVIKSNVRIIKNYGTKEDFENNEMKREFNIMFIINDKNGNTIFTGTTNKDGIIETKLPYGSYTLEQINTTNGFEKIENFNFTINEENSIAYDIVLNDFKIEVPNASISLIKSLSNILMELIHV